MSIGSLSNEVLTRIIESVAEDATDTKDFTLTAKRKQLHQIPLVSHRFQAIATPIIRQTYIETKGGSAELLIRALLRKEPAALGTSIKRFTSLRCYNESDNPMQSWTDSDFAQAETVIRDVGPDAVATSWMVALREGDVDALTGLALCLLPNLEELTFNEYSNDLGDNRNTYVSHVLNKASIYQNEGHLIEPCSLVRLKEVSISYADTEGGLRTRTLVPFLNLKSVKRLTAHAVADDRFQDVGNKFYAGELELDLSSIEAACLASFLGCFPHLKRLTYRIGDATVGHNEFSPQTFATAIRSLEHCLEEFIVEDDPDGFNFSGDPENSLPFGSLKGFVKLRKIVCGSAMLIGDPEITEDFHMNDDDSDHDEDQEIPVTEMSLVDVIPKSLRCLTLFDCGGGSELDYLRELLLRREELELEIEFIEFDYGGRKYEKEVAKALRRDCKDVGIKFVHR